MKAVLIPSSLTKSKHGKADSQAKHQGAPHRGNTVRSEENRNKKGKIHTTARANEKVLE